MTLQIHLDYFTLPCIHDPHRTVKNTYFYRIKGKFCLPCSCPIEESDLTQLFLFYDMRSYSDKYSYGAESKVFLLKVVDDLYK